METETDKRKAMLAALIMGSGLFEPTLLSEMDFSAAESALSKDAELDGPFNMVVKSALEKAAERLGISEHIEIHAAMLDTCARWKGEKPEGFESLSEKFRKVTGIRIL